MDFCQDFAQGLRTCIVLAGMGLGVAFTYMPLISMCKQVHGLFFFFKQDFSAFYKQYKLFTNDLCLWGPTHSTLVDKQQVTAYPRVREVTWTESEADIPFSGPAS